MEKDTKAKSTVGNEGMAALFHEIHEENTKKISDMSKEEVEAAQKELFANLDPSLLATLQRLGRVKQSQRTAV